MNATLVQSFGAELSRIADRLKTSVIWPSPATGLALRILLVTKCEQPLVFGGLRITFPAEALDDAPSIAAAGYAMSISEPSSEELARWQQAIRRLAKREPFPRDRQTFAYRPAELIGVALGIARGVQAIEATSWIRRLIQDLPSKSPPTDAWASLLYHYAASLVSHSWPTDAPARLSEYETPELGLLLALRVQGGVESLSEFELPKVQEALLQRVIIASPEAREPEKLAALYAGLSISLRANLPQLCSISPRTQQELSPANTMKQKILFLAANPKRTKQLALEKECREIEHKIRASEHRDALDLLTKWAVRPSDLLQYLQQHSPHIVHFSGHGSPTEELIFLDDHGKAKPVSTEALKQLFTTFKDNIRVVVLNACFSRPQAKAITEVIDCAIGMNRAIGDQAAITFAAAFYQAVGFGKSVRVAFDAGKSALMLEGIPEERTPELLVRNGVDPAAIFLIQPTQPAANP